MTAQPQQQTMNQPVVVNLIKPQEIPEAAKRFSKAATDLMCDKRTGFYSHLLMQTPVYWTRDVPTAGVDIRARMFVNPDFILGLDTVSNVVFLLAHELEHVLRLHPVRQGNRTGKRWNVACDAPMNADLIADRIGTFIEGGVDMPETKGMTPDAVYNTLDPEEDGDGPGGAGHDLIGKDALAGGQMTESDMRSAEGNMKSVIAAAAQSARVAGNMSAEMQRRIDEVLDVKTPWYEILERFMTEVSQTDYSWSKPNRRFMSQGIILPSLANQGALGKVGFIRDVSGSISDAEHEAMVGHINSIATRCLPSELVILDVSTTVHHTHEFTADDFPVSPEIHGDGGTDLTAGFDELNERHDDIVLCIVLTDGYTPWPSAPQDYPVITVCTTDIDVDYGTEVVRYEPEK